MLALPWSPRPPQISSVHPTSPQAVVESTSHLQKILRQIEKATQQLSTCQSEMEQFVVAGKEVPPKLKQKTIATMRVVQKLKANLTHVNETTRQSKRIIRNVDVMITPPLNDTQQTRRARRKTFQDPFPSLSELRARNLRTREESLEKQYRPVDSEPKVSKSHRKRTPVRKTMIASVSRVNNRIKQAHKKMGRDAHDSITGL